jgi:hypothetical protein
MGYQEKSAATCLISICLVYLPYFAFSFRFPMAGLGLIWLSVIGMVVMLVGFHVVIAVATRSMRRSGAAPVIDELDEKIQLTAAKWASLILAFAVLTWVFVAMYSIPVIGAGVFENAKATGRGGLASDFAIPVVTAMAAVHWLFAGFVFANAVYYGGIVVGYRRFAGA